MIHQRLVLFLFIVSSIGHSATSKPEASAIDQDIQHAETYLWLGIEEDLNASAFQKGLFYLQQAEKKISQLEVSSTETYTQIKARIKTLRRDLEQQLPISKGKFYGLFPLTRLINDSIFMDVSANRTYEIADTPNIVAALNALDEMVTTLSEQFKLQPQFDMFLRSSPLDPTIENEAIFLIQSIPSLNLHLYQDWSQLLSQGEINLISANTHPLPSKIADKICSQLQIEQFLVVTIEQIDWVDDIYYYRVIGHIQQQGKSVPAYTITTRGFSRDLHSQNYPILIAHLLFLALGLILFPGLIRWELGVLPESWCRDMGLAGLAFLVGRVLPWALIPTISNFRPAVDVPPPFAFWWLAVFGVAILILPVLLYRLVLVRRLPDILKSEASGGTMAMMMTLGSCAYLIVPTFLYFQAQAWPIIVPLALTGAAMGYLLGRTLDQQEIPIHLLALPILVSIPFGLVYAYVNLGYLWGVAVVSLAFVVAVSAYYLTDQDRVADTTIPTTVAAATTDNGQFVTADICDMIGLAQKLVAKQDAVSSQMFEVLPAETQRQLVGLTADPIDSQRLNNFIQTHQQALIDGLNQFSREAPSSGHLWQQDFADDLDNPGATLLPRDIAGLKAACITPKYIYNTHYYRRLHQLKGILDGESLRNVLVGSSGTGKSATALAVIQTLEKQALNRQRELVVLSGKCPPPHDSENQVSVTPYAPFQEALAREFDIDLFSSAGDQLSQLDETLDGIFESAIPFAGLLFPQSDEVHNAAGSNVELFVSIENTLRQLAKSRDERKGVVFFIDDIQWLDDASSEMLAYLLNAFQQKEAPVSFLMTSRSPEVAETFQLEADEIHSVTYDKPEEAEENHQQILTHALNLDFEVASGIVHKIGDLKDRHGALHWLLQVVYELADMGALIGEGNFVWSEDHQDYQKPETPLPVSAEMTAAIHQLLNRFPQHQPILECAACLGFEFHVEILAKGLETPRLAILRQLSEIEKNTNVISDVRDQHDIFAFRSSIVLEVIRQQMEITAKGPLAKDVPQIIREYHARAAQALVNVMPDDSFAIGRHFYAAGSKWADQAIQYCLKAAKAAVQQPALEETETYLSMAEEAAVAIGKSALNSESLQIRCHLSDISGRRQVETAESGLEYLQEQPDPPLDLKIAVALACYNARIFDKAVDLGEEIADHQQATLVQKAEGVHLVGIGSDPRSEVDKRHQYLQQAYDLLQESSLDDIPAQALLAKVTNSFAVQLERSDPPRARQLYQDSVDLKNQPELRDVHGLAISHNGLGRIAIFGQPPDIETAIHHFQQSLTYAERIGSPLDMSKSHSFLGLCAKQQEDYAQAVEEYQQSYHLAQSPVDRGFAGAGLLESYAALGDKANLTDFGQELSAQLADDGEVPVPCRDSISAALEQCRTLIQEGDWIHELENLLTEKR